jgi:uncharacterized membrane protein YedE/YeeE
MLKSPGIQIISSLFSGLIFGSGLWLSGMMDPRRVLGFLDVAGGAWDPTLAFVMGGALLITFPAFRLTDKLQTPVCSAAFNMPTNKVVDHKLIIGAMCFGAGWGLVGLCPGPALAALSTLNADVVLFVVALSIGMYIHDKFFSLS